MMQNCIRLLTLLILISIMFSYLLYKFWKKILHSEVTHSAYRRKKKGIEEFKNNGKQLLMITKFRLSHFLRSYEDKCIKIFCKLPQFLYKVNNIKRTINIVIYPAHLPIRLHGGNVDDEPPDGEVVFPDRIVANSTPEGLRIEVPRCFLRPNNPYRAVHAFVRTDRIRAIEAVAGSDMVTVQVCRQETTLTFNVPRGTCVDDFTSSEEFIKTVKDKWNILECDLQNMVLRYHNQVVHTFETDCKIRLDRGHMDLVTFTYD